MIVKVVNYSLDLTAILRVKEVRVELGDGINNLRVVELVISIRGVVNLIEVGAPLDGEAEGEGGRRINTYRDRSIGLLSCH